MTHENLKENYSHFEITHLPEMTDTKNVCIIMKHPSFRNKEASSIEEET